MRFKIVRWTTIRNGLKQTIFASGGLGLLQMVSEPDNERCASEDGEENEAFLIRVWKHSPKKTRFKNREVDGNT